MYKKLLTHFFILINLFFACGFINIFHPTGNRHIITPYSKAKNNINAKRKDRNIYSKYLLGLRKTRRLLLNNTNVNTLSFIVNFTNEFVSNYTQNVISNTTKNSNTNMSIHPTITTNPIITSTYINNTETVVKNIMMGNIVLDVSNVKHIQISTKKDEITIELDKRVQTADIQYLFDNINNLDVIVTTITMIGKIMNLS